MANLACTYRDQGKWKEAEALETVVMEKRKHLLGEEHPDTLTSMANLACTYRDQGKWKEAEALETVVMEKTKHLLGYTTSADDPQVYPGTCQKKPADHAPAAPDQIIPTDQSGSG